MKKRFKAEPYDFEGTVWTIYDSDTGSYLCEGPQSDMKAIAQALNKYQRKPAGRVKPESSLQ